MVFANTVEAVEAVADILEKASIQCYRYHKNHTLEERANILADFREKGGVFVCTDAAARGVDVPNVSHVIQVAFLISTHTRFKVLSSLNHCEILVVIAGGFF